MATYGAVINALSFGGVTSLGIIICALIARLVPAAFEESTWNLAYELVWGAFNFLVITLLNYGLVWIMYGDQVQFTLTGTLIVTLIVGFFRTACCYSSTMRACCIETSRTPNS